MNESPVQIVRATAEHLDLLVPLFDGYRQFYRQPADPAGARAFLSERLANDESVIFLALDVDGAGLGFTQLYPSFSSASMRRLWILNDLFVAPSGRGRGVGEALLECASLFAHETGAKGLTLQTATDNHTAQRLYERLGYMRGRSMLNGGADTTGQSGLGARVIGAHVGAVAPTVAAAHDSAAVH